MKERVVEDRGQLPIINHAVYAAAAALLHHNNLGTDLLTQQFRRIKENVIVLRMT
jgi:hypothetical protein